MGNLENVYKVAKFLFLISQCHARFYCPIILRYKAEVMVKNTYTSTQIHIPIRVEIILLLFWNIVTILKR